MKSIMIAVAAAVLCVGCSAIRGITSPSTPAVDNRPVGPDGERLNRIPGTTAIDIPAGIDNKTALDVFENAIIATGAGDKNLYWASQWRMEARDSGHNWIRVGLSNRQHYLSVCYRIEDGKMIPDVPASSNLKQDGINIHRKAVQWINRLNPLIGAKLYDAGRSTH